MTIGLTFESTQNQNSHFGAPKQRFETFVINHYAGSVAYTTNDFCEKNKDILSVDVVQMMQKSKVEFLQMSAVYSVYTVCLVASEFWRI